MTRIIIATIALVGLVSATTYATAAGGPPFGRGPDGQQRQNIGVRDGSGPGQMRGFGRLQGQNCVLGGLFDQNLAPLGEEEEHALLSMREEEKLARDVYLAMHDLWKQPVFANISGAEQRHMDALARLIDRYDVEDPVEDDTPGVFTNPVFGSLYGELVEDGSASLLVALKVGAMIEEMDIVDLREALDVTTHPDLQRAYENLMRGSRNHLRAFATQIDAAGGDYEAQHLTQNEFDEIAVSPMEPGSGRRFVRGGARGDGNGRNWANASGSGRGQSGIGGWRCDWSRGQCPNACLCNGAGPGQQQGVRRGGRRGQQQGRGWQGRGPAYRN